MIEVPPARIPEEPGAVIPHAGICKGGRRSTDVPTLMGKISDFPADYSVLFYMYEH